MKTQPHLVALCFLSLVVSIVHGSIHTYKNNTFIPVGDGAIFQAGREGLFASKDDKVKNINKIDLRDRNSFIRISNAVFERPEAIAKLEPKNSKEQTGQVNYVIFELKDRDNIGYNKDGFTHYCCTDDIKNDPDAPNCHLNNLIVNRKSEDDKFPYTNFIAFEGANTKTTSSNELVTIDETGMYFMWFAVCEPELQNVTISGYTTWKNPKGFLPGMMYSNLPFFGYMSLIYGFLAVIYFSAYCCNWKDTLNLQNYILTVIICGFFQMISWYADYNHFNKTGYRPAGPTMWAVLLGSVTKTFSRMLLLVVSMGYGVVRPTLGGMSKKVMALGLLYWIFIMLLDISSNVGAVDDMDGTERVFMVLPVAVLDAIFIVWIFNSLSRTVAQLQSRQQTTKLDIYRKFTLTLAAAVFFSIVFIILEMYWKAQDDLSYNWQGDWILNTFWHMMNLAVLLVICWLWLPTKNGNRYAYSNMDDEINFDVEMQNAPGKGSQVNNKRGVEMEGDAVAELLGIEDEVETAIKKE